MLDVRTVTGEYLIAMKLRAGRTYKYDLSDIVGILAEHDRAGKPITLAMIETAVENLYGGWTDFPENSISFIQAAISSGNYAAAYSDIQESERQARETLAELQEVYLDTIGQENIDGTLMANQT